jgi:hypothetical protein
VPAPQTSAPAAEQENAEDLEVRLVNPAQDTAFLDLAPKGRLPDEGPSQNNARRDGVERPAPQAAESADAPRRPWPIDAIMYPLSLIGVIHLVALWLLLFFLCPSVMSLVGLGTEYVPFVYTLPVAYALYYFAECVRGRAGGGLHVPDFWMHPGDSSMWDCLGQMFEVVGCIAVCFWPVSVYYIVREQVDVMYWLLLAGGGFVFPMVLLAVVLFDSFSALNPILIAGSILRTFVPYCGMVLLFCAGALLSVKIGFHLNGFHPLPTVPFLLWLVQLYMIFVAIALLGRFYQRHQDRLDWAV